MKNPYKVDQGEKETDIKVERLDGNLYINIEEGQLEEVKGFLDGHGYACSSEYSATKNETKLFKIKVFVDDVESEQLIVQKLLDSLEEVPAFDGSPDAVIRAEDRKSDEKTS